VIIAVTGASGYIGGRLVPQLLAAGHQVVCLARTPAKLDELPWRPKVEVRRCDVLDPAEVAAGLDGCDAAYYFVHSMGEHPDFADADRTAAQNFSDGAGANGLDRIVYLGGLGSDDDLSEHLESRHEVGRTLASGPTPVIELRAGIVIGSGSVSFEMLRYLTEVLPIMITPRWVDTRTQPVAISDVLAFLVRVLEEPAEDRIIEIGGPDVVTYTEMMQAYAKAAGLRRRIVIPVPVLTPRLSSLWVGLVTPLPVGVARPLVDSLRNEVVVHNDESRRLNIEPMSLREAIDLALDGDNRLDVPSRWSDASTSPAQALDGDPDWAGGTWLSDRKILESSASTDDLYWAFSRIGGSVGYYTQDWAWKIRGLIDVLVGGVGLRRGRRHPEEVRLHDTIDFWRVSSVAQGEHLQLAAEMRLPGEAWLEWRVRAEGGHSVLEQAAYFRPRGLAGRVYWFAMLPFHRLIFGRMARAITAAAEGRSSEPG
jgi:uncharacterized protein YbjT (DUF2867 family)